MEENKTFKAGTDLQWRKTIQKRLIIYYTYINICYNLSSYYSISLVKNREFQLLIVKESRNV